MNENFIPVTRVIQKLDEHLGKNDYNAALRHLLYWQKEAEALSDDGGLLTINCELMGLYRKISKKDEAIAAAERALCLLEKTNLSDSITAGTTLVDAATVFNAFGDDNRSLDLFFKARSLYEKYLDKNDGRLGALYNNCGLTLSSLNRFDEAEDFFFKALAVMKKAENGELDIAITHLNLANLYEKRDGIENAFEMIAERLAAARELIESKSVKRDSYYAFVCDKCANTFGYYKMEDYARELKARSKEIYERA